MARKWGNEKPVVPFLGQDGDPKWRAVGCAMLRVLCSSPTTSEIFRATSRRNWYFKAASS